MSSSNVAVAIMNFALHSLTKAAQAGNVLVRCVVGGISAMPGSSSKRTFIVKCQGGFIPARTESQRVTNRRGRSLKHRCRSRRTSTALAGRQLTARGRCCAPRRTPSPSSNSLAACRRGLSGVSRRNDRFVLRPAQLIFLSDAKNFVSSITGTSQLLVFLAAEEAAGFLLQEKLFSFTTYFKVR